MDLVRALQEAGLSAGEAQVYLALLQNGPSPVRSVRAATRLHRTTIYDFLHALLAKGLASSVVEDGERRFRAAPPERLAALLRKKEEALAGALPELRSLPAAARAEPAVEVYHGIEGLKTVLEDILALGEDPVFFGVDESVFKQKLPRFMDRYFAQEQKRGMRERVLTSADAPFVYRRSAVAYRTVPKGSFNPTPTAVWGDRVAHIIWEPLTVIKIRSPQLADSHRKHFELLWRQARSRRTARRRA